MENSDTANAEGYRVYTGASLGAAVRHFRVEAGVSQADLAAALGLSPSYLSRLENGHETEQLRRIVALLKHLGVRMTLARADW